MFARHDRHAEATRRAVRGWGLEILCRDPAEYSSALTAVMMPDGHDADAFRREVLARFDMSLGTGLGKLAGHVFRIGHLGDFNDLMLCGTLCGVEMGLARRATCRIAKNGVAAALDYLQQAADSRRHAKRSGAPLTAADVDMTMRPRSNASATPNRVHEAMRKVFCAWSIDMNRFIKTAIALAVMLTMTPAVAWEPTQAGRDRRRRRRRRRVRPDGAR